MEELTPEAVAQWEQLALIGVQLGVSSFMHIRAMMQESGADDAQITALEVKWEALVADVRKSAGL